MNNFGCTCQQLQAHRAGTWVVQGIAAQTPVPWAPLLPGGVEVAHGQTDPGGVHTENMAPDFGILAVNLWEKIRVCNWH